MEKLRYLLAFLLIFSFLPAAHAATKGGSIWTTLSACGEDVQNENHYAVGETIYVHGENYAEGVHPWSIAGLPGGASSDPGQVVASGDIAVDASGSFCFAAYIVQPGDDGEYKVDVARKHDNYRVEGEAALTCEQALEQGLLTGEITGNTAFVENNAGSDFEITLASYEMFAPIVEDQILFDTDTQTVEAGASETFEVEVPACAYQLDLVCGQPVVPPFYEESLDTEIVLDPGFCVFEAQGSNESISANLSVADNFPQGQDYVLECSAQGFSAASYNWYFGDGQYLFDTAQDSVFHTYGPGSYTAACRASDGVNWAVGTVEIVVA